MVDQTHQQSGDIADDSSMPSREGSPARVADPSYLKPTSDRTSDIEASEGPVREKLKKTSIASIPRQAGSSGNAEEHEAEANPTIAHVLANDAQAAGDGSSPEATDRGRPARKRSFDDLDMDKATPSDHHEPDIGNQGGRERKRSKDVRASRGPHSDTDEVTLSAIRPADVVEKRKKAEEDDESTEVKKIPNDMNEELIPASIDTELVDEEMHQSTFSPRKKRSRDQLDADSQREQKIPATEEAKAHRRSEEHERDDKPQEDDDGLPQGGTSAQSGEASTAQKVPQTAGEVTLFLGPPFTRLAYSPLGHAQKRLWKYIKNFSLWPACQLGACVKIVVHLRPRCRRFQLSKAYERFRFLRFPLWLTVICIALQHAWPLAFRYHQIFRIGTFFRGTKYKLHCWGWKKLRAGHDEWFFCTPTDDYSP
jgi:hypothetical protein